MSFRNIRESEIIKNQDQSEISEDLNLEDLDDFFRMLGASDYPKTRISRQGYILELSHAELGADQLETNVIIRGKT